ncbi:MAG: ATP-binding domain-containing protein [Zoogloeaceae bacterium]|nr:ATP-binding domain-containing protein [Zoogloeaceae bacterium]MCP5254895.1 ATP-binding domain-containing protein [Zoogloeaceae bacterium]MCP5295603.1 ATP-binding domain-containing protein [Zoogloeaceae bacterium]MCW5616317.1 ATP-binding domain-containing protein [Rhodocyclaceae bacterium]
MAKVFPDGWRELEATGAAQREIETLGLLAAALPDDYTIYHSVHWTCLEQGFSIYGDVDFAVVNRAGDLLFIEQKSGFLNEGRDGLSKRQAGRSIQVAAEISRVLHVLGGKLAARLGDEQVRLEYLFYCPDYHIREPQSAGLEAARIVDASRRDRLAPLIREVLPAGEDAGRAATVHRFLRDVIRLEPDVSALIGHARSMITRVAGGLAQWARQLDFEPFRLRVEGTAGSGKTQLALAEYRAAVEAGKRPLYLCYNRPLADQFNRVAPAGGLALTFHSLCDRLLRAAGRAPDFSRADAFERLVEEAAALEPDETFRFDVLIVDEGQDFSERWRDLALRHAGPDARVLWLEDPLQNLYGRAPVALPGWVSLRADSNFRSPRAVVRLLRELLPEGGAIEAASPIASSEVSFLVYQDEAQMAERVKEAIRLCYSEGFRKEDLAIVSWRGREHSRLIALERLGANTLKHFTGEYDLLGEPRYTAGDVLVESVYRFKGQSAPAVILAEMDFGELDQAALRKLFVGATRAMMKLVVVLSADADRALKARLGQPAP